MAKNTTIKDVAKKAGVSIATVSFVLNDSPGQVISEPVKKKVFKAAKALNYHRSAIAAGLASKKSGNIAIVSYRNHELISNQFYSFIVQGAVREAALQNINIFFSFLDGEYEEPSGLPLVVRERNTDGVIFVGEINAKMVVDIEANNIPVVAVDHFPRMSAINAIESDNYRSGQLAVEHLTALGHKDIVFLYAHGDRPSIRGRMDGFRHALEETGCGFSESNNFCDCEELTFERGMERTGRILSRKNIPTAICCANDELAAGVLRAIHMAGLKVPDDISVVGCDDITMSNYTDPPLTTVASAKEALGAHATRRLINLLKDKNQNKMQEVLPVELVVRASTGEVRKK
jgi:LacI family transcriptional regulator